MRGKRPRHDTREVQILFPPIFLPSMDGLVGGFVSASSNLAGEKKIFKKVLDK